MTNISAKEVADLRAKTGAGMMDCKKALVEAAGDEGKAIEILKKKGALKAAKRAERETKAGVIESYIHANHKIGVIVEVLAESDFVAKNDEFKELAHDIALHIAAMNPQYISKEDVPASDMDRVAGDFGAEMNDSGKPADIVKKIIDGKMEKYFADVCLLYQPFVKDNTKTIEDLINEKVAKIGEKIVVSRFSRFEIGC